MTEETKEVQQEVQVPQGNTQPEQGQPVSDLNLNDLAAIRSVLEVASQRGAFKANELEAVGKVYNKLNNFLEAVAKKEQ